MIRETCSHYEVAGSSCKLENVGGRCEYVRFLLCLKKQHEQSFYPHLLQLLFMFELFVHTGTNNCCFVYLQELYATLGYQHTIGTIKIQYSISCFYLKGV